MPFSSIVNGGSQSFFIGAAGAVAGAAVAAGA
jgi:hypothetical protein